VKIYDISLNQDLVAQKEEEKEEEKDSLDGGDGDLADELHFLRVMVHAQCLVLIHSQVA
jgi:hypothetical protein